MAVFESKFITFGHINSIASFTLVDPHVDQASLVGIRHVYESAQDVKVERSVLSELPVVGVLRFQGELITVIGVNNGWAWDLLEHLLVIELILYFLCCPEACSAISLIVLIALVLFMIVEPVHFPINQLARIGKNPILHANIGTI